MESERTQYVEWERENSFVDLQRFGVMLLRWCWRKALNSNQKTRSNSIVNRATDEHRGWRINILTFTQTHIWCEHCDVLCDIIGLHNTQHTAVRSCVVYMVLSYVLNEILNSHEHSFATNDKTKHHQKFRIAFNSPELTVPYFSIWLLCNSNFFFVVLSVFSLA